MVTWLLSVLIGLGAGVLSGMGVGGGTLLVLYLTTFAGVDPKAAAAINLVFFLGCAPWAIVQHAKAKRIDTTVARKAAIGGVVTAAVCAALSPPDSPDWMHRLFGVLLLVVGVRELWQLLHSEKKSG
ncbi:MAG: sulfite exporter TauE/SafE family protein [Clostridia bacterium]|nr:sulfite exporter TauE/SafE family protein [Clostridia bacterium]